MGMRAILLLCIGMFAISVNDLLFKSFSGDYSLHQLVLMRTSLSMALLLPIFLYTAGKATFVTKRLGAHLVRSSLLVMANLIFFTSLAVLPLAETTAIVFLSPLLLTVFAFFFLKEQVGLIRWICIAFGFVGTILVIQPFSVAFTPVMIMPLCAAFLYASFTTLTRHLSDTESTQCLAFYTLFGFLVTSGLVGLTIPQGIAGLDANPMLSFLFRPWRWPEPEDLKFIAMIGLSSAGIAFCLSAAYRIGEASMLAPFEYVALPFSILWGFLFFNDLPNSLAFFGMLIIVSAGMVLAYRELTNANQDGRIRRSVSPRSLTAQGNEPRDDESTEQEPN